METNKQLKSFKDLLVWQKAVDLASLVYKITEGFPNSELYGLTSQMRRAAISISSNLAEGFKRNHKKEKLQFYNVAYGSVAELESQIEVSGRLNFLHNDECQRLNAAVTEIGKMIDGLIKSINKKSPKFYILNSIFLILSFYFLFSVSQAEAKTVFYFQGEQTDKTTTDFTVKVLVDSDEPLNAYDLTIAYPSDLVSVKSIDNSHSIINIWQNTFFEPPTNGPIKIKGGSLKSFQGEAGEIISLHLTALKIGRGDFIFEKAAAYLADGRGTMAGVETKNSPLLIYSLVLEPSTSTEIIQGKIVEFGEKDKLPPLINFLKIEKNPFNDKEKLLIFDVQDKDSGIKSIWIKTKSYLSWSNWQEASNPYSFSPRVWAIRFRVMDNSGNISERIIYRWDILIYKVILAVVLLSLLVFLVRFGIRKFKGYNN